MGFAVRRFSRHEVLVKWELGPTEDEVRAAFGDENDHSIQGHIQTERHLGDNGCQYVAWIADCLRTWHPDMNERDSQGFACFLLTEASFPAGAVLFGIERLDNSSFQNGKYRLVLKV